MKQVIFKLDQEEYGFDVMEINSIEEYEDIVRIPNAPANILGMINLRGEVIPVYSLRNKFGLLPKKPGTNSRLIVVNTKGVSIGFEVDCVNEILEIMPENINETPSIVKSISTKYINKVAKVKDRMIILLNINNIIDDNEKGNIEEIIKSQ